MRSICIVAYTDYATDARVTRQAEAAAEAGFDVDVLTPGRPTPGGGPDEGTVGRLTVHRLGGRQYRGSRKGRYILGYAAFFLRCLIRISILQLRNKYRVVQVCNMPDVLVFAAVFAKLAGAKVLLDIHDPMPRLFAAKFPGPGAAAGAGLIRWLERRSAAFADGVLTVHEPIKRDLLVADGIPESKISVVANFPDDRLFRPVAPYRIEGPIRMVYYGTVAARFGFADVLAAIREVGTKDRLLFKIIGGGDGESDLRKSVEALGLGSIVEFENRSYPLRQIPSLIGRFHLGLVPYAPSPATDYMLPVKLLELLALGIPAITVPNTAIRYYLDEQLYFGYNPEEMGTLTRLLDRLLGEPSLLEARRRAILAAAPRFAWSTERPKYLEVLNRLSK